MTNLECPSCAAQIDLKQKFSKFLICKYCSSAIFIEDDAVRNAGKFSKVADVPSLIHLDHSYEYRNASFYSLGMVRYDYGKGFWDEWHVISNNKSQWISIDEGDIAIEEEVEKQLDFADFNSLKIGDKITINDNNVEIPLIVTEKNRCKCIAAQGELPFEVVADEEYNYIDLSGPANIIYTVEYTEDGVQIYKGKWIDPFDLKEL